LLKFAEELGFFYDGTEPHKRIIGFASAGEFWKLCFMVSMETSENKGTGRAHTSKMAMAIWVVNRSLCCGFMCGKRGIGEVSFAWPGGWSERVILGRVVKLAKRGMVAEEIRGSRAVRRIRFIWSRSPK
jgi:hypothetical protein